MSNAMPPWKDQPYSVKRHGATIENCDSEPVQTPGCIQDHGALLVLRPSDLVVLQTSVNLEALLRQLPEELLGQPVARVVGLDGAERIKAFLAGEPTNRSPLYVFTLPARGASLSLDVTAHTIEGLGSV